jgi:glycosyltransferase involved in cell wall biosynthesis
MAKPEPILFLNQDLSSGGTEHALLTVLQNLDRKRFAPALWVRSLQGDLLSKYQELEIEIRPVPAMMSDGARHKLVWKLPINAMRLRRFSLVHSFSSTASWTEPWSIHLAGVRGYLMRRSDHYQLGPARSWEVRQRTAHRIVCVTESIFNRFYRGTEYEDKALVVHNGVDAQRFRPQPAAHDLRTRFGLPPQAALFASVANLSRNKGQLQVLAALARAKARDIPLYVAFAGRDLAEGDIHRRAGQLGVADRALFLGRVVNIPELLAQCAGMILMSPREGCSNAVLESLSCGTPVILPANGAEELIEDGKSGFCVPTGDVDECVRLMQELHARPELRMRMGHAARQRVLQHFTLEGMARRYQDLYDEVLSSPHGDGASNHALSSCTASRQEPTLAASVPAMACVGAARESHSGE